MEDDRMTEIIKQDEEVIIIGKTGNRTLMPSFEFAKQRANGIWKGEVKNIEVKTTYIVANKELFEKSLEAIELEITELESDKNSVSDENVINFINSRLILLQRELIKLKHSLELINR